ncbi:hypothetical protein C5167_015201 [Papaver somniferum]|uniref:Uncharacterized protein n=1 Tax=Papaver somniferum TaxID=3469 RepID=A0A4Y7J697_PAPSO|nr:hypothetical protein C5167_015201 [Papaver somniferum]
MSEKVMRAHVQVPIPKPNKDAGGIARPFMPKKFPYIPVTDISGEVGSDVLFQVGDKVVAMLAYTARYGGGLGEYAVAPAKPTVKRPEEVSAVEGAGHYVVQLANLGNNHVTAACGARNIQLLKSLGADEVLDL